MAAEGLIDSDSPLLQAEADAKSSVSNNARTSTPSLQVKVVDLGPLSDGPLQRRSHAVKQTASRSVVFNDPLHEDASARTLPLRRETVGATPSSSQKTSFIKLDDMDRAGTLDPRLVRSWCPGSQRKEVFQPLRTTKLSSCTPEEDFCESRTFGGIERQIRPTLPSVEQVNALSTFMRLFRAQATSRKRKTPTVVAFVNSRSGGQAGSLIMKTLLDSFEGGKDAIVHGSVCDLSLPNEPEASIEAIADGVNRQEEDSSDMRLIVCGGDGTVTWILSALENCKRLRDKLHLLPVAIVPLGTGNDLARSLGWGPKLRAVSDILWYLKWVVEAEPVTLDQWRIVLRPHKTLPDEHKLRTCGSHPQLVTDPQLSLQLLGDLHDALELETNGPAEIYLGYWQNYFSMGVDARVARHVDVARSHTACGKCCFRRGCGKACYFWQALVHASFGTVLPHIIRTFKIAQPGAPEEKLDHLQPGLSEVSGGVMKQMMFVNINSYGSGLQALPDARDVSYTPSPGDGILEFLGLRNTIAGAGFFAGLSRPTYVSSAEAAAFTLQRGEYMQLDGEPWLLDCGADVMLELHKKVTMLRAPKEARFWRGHMEQDFWPVAPTSPSNPPTSSAGSRSIIV